MPKTYNDLYIALYQRLRDAGVAAHTLEARLIVAAAAEKTQEELLRDLHLYSSDGIESRVNALAERRLNGEPAAYVTGRWGFYGLEFRLTRDVLIPRMDTEVLAEQAIKAALTDYYKRQGIDPEPIVGKLEEEVETDPDEDELL